MSSINVPSTGQKTWKLPVLSLNFICIPLSLTLNNVDNSVTLTCPLPCGRNDSAFPQINLMKSILIATLKENIKYNVKENIRATFKNLVTFHIHN